MPDKSDSPIQIFCIYAHEDEARWAELLKHLRGLVREGQVGIFSDRQIQPGQDWRVELDTHLRSSHIVLVLVSPDSMDSDPCDSEIDKALSLAERGHTVIIPVLLRPFDWASTKLSKLQALPTNATPIASWEREEEAYRNVATGIRKVITDLIYKSHPDSLVGVEGNRVDRQTLSPEALPVTKLAPYGHTADLERADELLVEPRLGDLYEPIHGTIDLHDSIGATSLCRIAELLGTRMVDRLRRIKLLGYASHGYPAADHSRYAHALGSMQVMRSLALRLLTPESQWPRLKPELRQFGDPVIDTPGQLAQHMLVATLLQDVGELPYSHASSRVLRASAKTRLFVAESTGLNVSDWSDKDIFTVASICSEDCCRKLNLPLLVYLITGSTAVPVSGHLRALRHMIDGEVDADRLDYVYRDAHHTLGGRGSPRTVIESILYYDEYGPVFRDPGPVSEFLATRSFLWTRVYFSAENRFRMLLLITLLKGVLEHTNARKFFFDIDESGEVSLEVFHKLDDISLNLKILELSEKPSLVGKLDHRAQNALKLLLGRGSEYESFWLPAQRSSGERHSVPPDLFFDSYLDYEDQHRIYEPGSIRVRAARFSHLDNPMRLEDCCGAFSGMFKNPWSALERPGSILIFKPRNTAGGGWADFDGQLKQNSLLDSLLQIDPLTPLNVPSDTRYVKAFKPPNIFISFSWRDVHTAKVVLDAVYRKRRRYFFERANQYSDHEADIRPNETLGDTGAVLILGSANYVRHLESAALRPHREFLMIRDALNSGLRPVVLMLDADAEIVPRLNAVFGDDKIRVINEQYENSRDAEKIVAKACRLIDSSD